MPYPVPVMIEPGDRLLFTVRCAYRGQVALNKFTYHVELGATSEDAFGALQAWQNDALSKYIPLLNSQALFVDATLRIKDVASGLQWGPTLFAITANQSGLTTGGALPTQVAGIITRRVNLKTNANRGRVYIPFASISDCDPDESPTTSYVSRLNALAFELMPLALPYLSVGGNNWDPVLANTGFTLFHELIDYDCHKKWATQRRRGDYGIPNASIG